MAELSLEMILAATQGRVVGAPPPLFPGVSIDTRTLAPGQLFVALQGERDGHDFVPSAFAQGAGAALVSRELAGAGGPQIVVEDTLRALGAIGARRRRALELKVIAITGSVGKTTVKEMLAAILSQGWRTLKSRGNYNNEIGVPLTLLALDASYQAAVVEMAMRGRGQIAYLAQLAQPQLGVITNIGKSHLELLGSRDAIAESKAELVEALPRDGVAVLNADDDYFPVLSARSAARVVSFGTAEGAEVRVTDAAVTAEGLRFRLSGELIAAELTCGVAGRHHALNAAAAAAAALSAGVPAEWVIRGLAEYEAGEMRGRVITAPGGYTVVDDSYNAAPDSVRAALALLTDLPGNRKWAVLGDMKELGDATLEEHHEIGRAAAEAGLAGLITVGELGRHIAEGAREAGLADVVEAADNAEARARIASRLAAGDVALVKGSRAMQMEEIVAGLLAVERGGHG